MLSRDMTYIGTERLGGETVFVGVLNFTWSHAVNVIIPSSVTAEYYYVIKTGIATLIPSTYGRVLYATFVITYPDGKRYGFTRNVSQSANYVIDMGVIADNIDIVLPAGNYQLGIIMGGSLESAGEITLRYVYIVDKYVR